MISTAIWGLELAPLRGRRDYTPRLLAQNAAESMVVEEALQSHPDIAEAGACGVVDAVGVEQLWVAVVVRRDIAVQAITDFLYQRDPKMAPRNVKFVSTIPRTDMGKVAREALKKVMTQ